MPLLWRVFVINALVMSAGVVLLIATPATVSSPIAASQLVVIALGLAVMLVLNLLLLRPYIGPLHELTGVMARVDLLSPGARVVRPTSTPELRVVSDAFNGMLDRLEDERRRSSRRALAAQEGERLRVSRELHDGVGQRLTGVLLRLQSLEAQMPEQLHPEATALREQIRLSLEEVRDTARRLRPEALEDLGLTSALVALTHDLSRADGLSVSRAFAGSLDAIGNDLEVVIYRVAQEALTNVVRHAGARHAELALTRKGDEVVLTVTDDGRGFDPATTPMGAGLTGMRERALLVNSALAISSRPGAGTAIRLEARVGGA